LRRVDFGDGTDSSEESLGCFGLAGFDEDAVQVVLHPTVTREIGTDKLCGFLLGDPELLSQPESRQTIDDAEIDGLGGSAVLGGLRHGPDAKDFLGRSRVDVFAAAEGLDKDGILRKVGHDAEFDLRVVGRKKNLAGLSDEGGANLTAEFGTNRNILQIWIARAEAARSRTGLRVARVQSPGVRMDEFW